MIAAAFLLSTSVVVKMPALGLGVSVLIDASVIRLLIVPATMFLLGRYNCGFHPGTVRDGRMTTGATAAWPSRARASAAAR